MKALVVATSDPPSTPHRTTLASTFGGTAISTFNLPTLDPPVA